MERIKPKLICLTPTRNDAWVLDIFLQETSRWADYIFLVDQNSTDNTIEIAKKYPKTRVFKYDSIDFDEGAQKAVIVNEARKIEDPKILFGLDSDEILSANFEKTNDWKKIIESKPGDVFAFQWANILPNKSSYFPTDLFCPWVVNDNGCEYKNYVKKMHGTRIPYPTSADKGWNMVTEFKVLHLSHMNKLKTKSKNRYYQCVFINNESNEHFISLFRDHNRLHPVEISTPGEWVKNEDHVINFDMVDTLSRYFWYDDEIIRFFRTYGLEKYRYLCIWDNLFLESISDKIQVRDPRSFTIKMIHHYLKFTQVYYNLIIIRVIDKILKILI